MGLEGQTATLIWVCTGLPAHFLFSCKELNKGVSMCDVTGCDLTEQKTPVGRSWVTMR